MSLYGYKPRTAKALWTTTAGAARTRAALADLKAAKRSAEAVLKRDRAIKAKRARDLDRMARGLRKVKPTRTPKQKATAADRSAYRKRVAVWVADKMCVACLARTGGPGAAATQCHHKHGRGHRGELLLVEELWLPVCSACHDWIHKNVAAARELGLYAPAGQWNEKPRGFSAERTLKL